METNPNQVKPRKHFPLIEEENNDQKIGALLRVSFYSGCFHVENL